MPITTYADKPAIPLITKHLEINSLMRQVRARWSDDWQILECEHIVGRRVWWQFWQSPKSYWSYQIMCHLQTQEWQIINFWRDGEHPPINVWVSADLMIAFLYGLLASRPS